MQSLVTAHPATPATPMKPCPVGQPDASTHTHQLLCLLLAVNTCLSAGLPHVLPQALHRPCRGLGSLADAAQVGKRLGAGRQQLALGVIDGGAGQLLRGIQQALGGGAGGGGGGGIGRGLAG